MKTLFHIEVDLSQLLKLVKPAEKRRTEEESIWQQFNRYWFGTVEPSDVWLIE